AAHINSALTDEMAHRPELMVFGEDVGKKGGVYGVTARLQERFGAARVFDTLLDETTILGVAQGAGHVGFLPIPEIQYLAYLHNALDQLRSEACSLSYFSQGQFTNPMVVRIAGYAYQKGFGGHFHNDNSIGALRDIPGLVIASPSRGDDAARMLRGLISMAKVNGRVCCFVEPIALYHERDLHEAGDNGWLTDYAPPGDALLPGDIGVYGEENDDLLIVSYANGLRLSLQAARILEEREGIRARVIDLRWLSPLPVDEVLAHAEACGKVVIADECRSTGGGIASELTAGLFEAGFRGGLGSVRAADTYIPLGPATEYVLIGRDDIVAKAIEVVR
ncbi:MAG: 2-oxoisovalerate dehydrogenase E1 component, partial [Planctomycetota bacterium]